MLHSGLVTVKHQDALLPMPSHDNRFPFSAALDYESPALPGRRPSLGDEVYDNLLAQLISLRIAPGSRIAIDALVRELGVSQTPIRAALIRLESEGLVVKTHNVGFSAAPMPTRQQFGQIYEMRMLLEPHAAALAARHYSADVEPQLQTMVRAMEQANSGDAQITYSKFAVQDAEFHAWIARLSGNPLIEEALSRLHAHMHLFRVRFHTKVTQDAITEHAQIVQALRNRDEHAASSAMLHHLQCSLEGCRPSSCNRLSAPNVTAPLIDCDLHVP